MALIKCPECGKEVSDAAVSCPNCGFSIKGETQYELKTVDINCGGLISGKKVLEKKLQKFIDEGWEVVSTNKVPNYNAVSFVHMYTCVLRRKK